jgi:chemotaxis protein CheD
MVRMGELAATQSADDVLTTIGLGSCLGVALLDSKRGAAGLAHVVFPAAPVDQNSPSGKYADTAVPALLAALAELGSGRASLEAVLVGGARMFSSNDLDVGASNLAATRAALDSWRIPIRATAVGGSVGRSVRVGAAEAVVSVREAGADSELFRASRSAGEGAPR